MIIEFYEKATGGLVPYQEDRFVIDGTVYRDNYEMYESQSAVISLHECIVETPAVGWRVKYEDIPALPADMQEHAQNVRRNIDLLQEIEYSDSMHGLSQVVDVLTIIIDNALLLRKGVVDVALKDK